MLSNQERVDRILNTTHIVDINDSSIYRVENISCVGSIVFINTGGVHYQDTEVMTLEEWSNASMAIEHIESYLNKL